MRDLRVSFPRPCGEEWQAMTPAACARVCGRCDKPVHDLSQYSLDEAEALVRSNPGVCVRARIEGDGSIALKPSRLGEARRMVIAVAATAGLLAASAPAIASQDRSAGTIAGKVQYPWFRTHVIATGANGQTFRARVKNNGKFRLGHLPAGTYALTFHPDCGDSWTVEDVVVGAGETIVPDTEDRSRCITIGMLRIEDDRA
jgi:hypothetical protein